jgi:primosomal protein N' (replication factor Y)
MSARSQLKPSQIKPIQSVIENIRFSSIQRQLIDRFAEDFLVSPGTVVNMIIGDMPRRGILAPTQAVLKHPSLRKSKTIWQSDSLVWHLTNQEKVEYINEQVSQAIKQRKHILIISPEIRQVKAWESALYNHRPLVIHRQLPRSLYWQKVAALSSGQPAVVIGTRSALWLPHQRLDLIVIDAEDNANHRQTEMNPRYHTEQVARLLQEITGAGIHWISPAPRLSTWRAYRTGKIQLVDLRSTRPAPTSFIANMNDERKVGNRTMLSERVQRFIAANLKAHKQTVLYLNRRGESTGFVCRDCGHGFSCPRCQRPLILHRFKPKHQILCCHLCEYTMDMPINCPTCQGTDFKHSGWRVQLLESEVRALYPDAKIALREAGSAPIPTDTNIIIGTQIILTAEILERVDLIVFVSVDQLLALPDFSAPEQTFRQMSLAVAETKPGATLVFQTFKPEHHAVRFGAQADLDGFYAEEMRQRALFHYPPLKDLARLILKGKIQKKVIQEAEELSAELEKRAAKIPDVEILHASPSFIAKTRGQYRWELVLKYPPKYWPEIRDLLKLSSDRWLMDLQPQSLL